MALAAWTQSSLISLVAAGSGAPFSGLFVCGMYCYLSRQSGRLHFQLVPAASVACVLGAQHSGSFIDAVVYAVLISAFVAVALAPRVPLLTIRPLLWLGTISYPLYLVHQSIGYAIQFRLTPLVGRPYAFALALVCALGLAQILHVAIEERASRWLRRVLHQRFGSSSPTMPPAAGVVSP